MGPDMDSFTTTSVTFYHSEETLGSGSFGIVFKARVVETGEYVAIKQVFQDNRHKCRELQIMKQLKHPNVVELKHAFWSNGIDLGVTCLNIVMECCSGTVHQVLKQYNKVKQSMPTILVQLYSYQTCRACAYLHALGICHRDIKPQNLLVDFFNHALKLCDFGSAKRLSEGTPSTAYICSRHYRAPELILGATTYTTAIDIWSTACVTAELVFGSPIFPGNDGRNQLVKIIMILGTPKQEDLHAMNPKHAEFKFPYIKQHPWPKVFRSCSASPAVSNFVAVLLRYDPKARPSALEACAHSFFDRLRDKDATLDDGTQLPQLFEFTGEEMDLIDVEMQRKLLPNWYSAKDKEDDTSESQSFTVGC
eukprot:TRINITY_DN34967_c0_g1_i1.p1 TRINITY_DN34967_c0_g1~~TRINITY_DN34967_c0_g1_i1.p1  ORF type:complete len:364 (-),score=60.15 TRINITY_DN34967_c0_g1_i1:73-1164(-)